MDELSAIGLFMQADWVVKGVMLLLLLASVWCWAVIFSKAAQFTRLRRRAARFEDEFWSGGSLTDLHSRAGELPPHPMLAVFTAAMREWLRATAAPEAGAATRRPAFSAVRERMDRVMAVTIMREMESVERHLPFLATVGSTAPFIGLLGTVWGIMNSFAGIAASKQTSLAVVAPGIAEALFATALGLVAAIPATVAYNRLSAGANRYAAQLEAFAAEFSALISRQIDGGGEAAAS